VRDYTPETYPGQKNTLVADNVTDNVSRKKGVWSTKGVESITEGATMDEGTRTGLGAFWGENYGDLS